MKTKTNWQELYTDLSPSLSEKLREARIKPDKLKTAPVADLIKQTLKLKKGSGEPNKDKVGQLSKEQIKQIAEKKLPDLNTANIEQAIKIIEGTARSMGVTIK